MLFRSHRLVGTGPHSSYFLLQCANAPLFQLFQRPRNCEVSDRPLISYVETAVGPSRLHGRGSHGSVCHPCRLDNPAVEYLTALFLSAGQMWLGHSTGQNKGFLTAQTLCWYRKQSLVRIQGFRMTANTLEIQDEPETKSRGLLMWGSGLLV